MQHYVITFKARVGEVEHYLQRIIKTKDNEKLHEAIHNTLHNFWGKENTTTIKKGRHYHREWQESLKIHESKRISKEKYQTMKPYIKKW